METTRLQGDRKNVKHCGNSKGFETRTACINRAQKMKSVVKNDMVSMNAWDAEGFTKS